MLLSTASCPFHQLAGLPLDLRRSTTRQRHAVRLLPCTVRSVAVTHTIVALFSPTYDHISMRFYLAAFA